MGFLNEIVGEVKSSVDAEGYDRGLPSSGPPTPPSLRAAVRDGARSGALLVEYKRVSPGSRDPRLPLRDVREFVEQTSRPVVVGYSCLATHPRFEGSPQDVAALVRSTSRPVLFKDFVVDPRQLDVARRAGASAVLLIARLERTGVAPTPTVDLARRAHALGLEVVLEFHARSELSVASGVSADMYAVNVRDLDSLALDRATADATLDAACAAGLRPLLGFSGVSSPDDAARFWDHGADGILVGSAVARSDAPGAFLDSLARPAPRGHR